MAQESLPDLQDVSEEVGVFANHYSAVSIHLPFPAQLVLVCLEFIGKFETAGPGGPMTAERAQGD